MIDVGKRLGFGLYFCTPNTFDKKKLVQCDLLIINNFFFFKPEQFHFILDLIFEYKRPYVKYEHDHREIIGEQARLQLARLLFKHSILNVFISPTQLQNHQNYLGDVISPYFLLPPAIDTKRFRILKDTNRNKKKMVNVSGRLYESKGFRHMLQFAMAKQGQHSFEIYTKNYKEVREVFGKLGNVKVLPPVENDYLPKVYNSAGYVIHLPRALEACGRTIAEGLLCGCKPITNENVGIRSFKEFHIGNEKEFSLRRFKRYIEHGLFGFWRAVDMSFHGLYDKRKETNLDMGRWHKY